MYLRLGVEVGACVRLCCIAFACVEPFLTVIDFDLFIALSFVKSSSCIF